MQREGLLLQELGRRVLFSVYLRESGVQLREGVEAERVLRRGAVQLGSVFVRAGELLQRQAIDKEGAGAGTFQRGLPRAAPKYINPHQQLLIISRLLRQQFTHDFHISQKSTTIADILIF